MRQPAYLTQTACFDKHWVSDCFSKLLVVAGDKEKFMENFTAARTHVHKCDVLVELEDREMDTYEAGKVVHTNTAVVFFSPRCAGYCSNHLADRLLN